MALRKMTPQEERLLELLIKKATITVPSDWKERIAVELMDDGLNRLLTLYPKGIREEDRTFGKNVSEHIFKDEDGVAVSAALYIDKDCRLLELDMWKTDDSPLIRIPDDL